MSQDIGLQSVRTPRCPPGRVLVLGSSGMLGRSWVDLLARKGIEHRALRRPEFDLADPDSIRACLEDEYDLVVNAAAWTDVDGAETDEQGAIRANATAVEELAIICKEKHTPLITYSTDYVFNGVSDRPFPIDAPIDPINAYGRSKALGEERLRATHADHILIRTSWVYAPWGNNFVRTMRRLLQERPEVTVVHDQRGRPSSAPHLAAGSLSLFCAGAGGTWHLCDHGECTWYELAMEIGRIDRTACRIEPCTSEQFPRPAKRPRYSTLEIQSSEELIGVQGHWQDRLREVCALLDQSGCNQGES